MGHAFWKLLEYREKLPAGSPLLPIVNFRLNLTARALLARAIATLPAGSPESLLIGGLRDSF